MASRLGVLFLILLAQCVACGTAWGATTDSNVERHPQEIRALKDPQSVLAELPLQIAAARQRADFRELALLHLAEANACRVMGNFACQAAAGQRAHQAAEQAGQVSLQVRGLIIESRGRLALQDFSRTSQLLTTAERILNREPNPEALADVYLAYSSLSYSIGKHAKAAEYARRGLDALGDRPSLIIRIRLIRNQARALAQTKDTAGARAALRQAIGLIEGLDDPKLVAELFLESARIARSERDVATQEADGRKILELAKSLENTQVTGLGHEVLGLAALDRKDRPTAKKQLTKAHQYFQDLKLYRDERRVLRFLLGILLEEKSNRGELDRLMMRMVSLESKLELEDRTFAADDFEARLNFFKQEMDVKRLEEVAAIDKERVASLAEQRKLAVWVSVLVATLLVVVAILFVMQRKYTGRLAESESRYRMLADNSRDLVVRMRPDGHRLYVSPASRELLGLEPEALLESKLDLVHPDDKEALASEFRRLGEQGGSTNVVYRARHADGHYVWIEAAATLVQHSEATGQPEILYAGRDVSARVRAEMALAESEARLRAVTDNIPALIARVDQAQRYTFANAFMGRVFGVDPQSTLGRTMRETRGEEIYSFVEPYVLRALKGEAVQFEGTGMAAGREYHFRSHYVPDIGPDGAVTGFFALTFDITDLKRAQTELGRLIRIDSMTGVANRRHFDERLTAAIASARRHGTAICLLSLDIDHFKQINDTHGHAAGDAVIIEVAERMRSQVRAEDLVARLGGDEFAVIIEQAEAVTGATIAAKMLAAMQAPVVIGSLQLPVKVSIGVGFALHPDTFEHLLGMADRALYRSKSAGRGTYTIETD